MERVSAPDDAMPARVAKLPTWLLNRTSALAHRFLREGFAVAGIRGYQYRLLAALEEFGPASQAALGRRTAIDRADVVAAINDLAARGLADRAGDPQDRRRNVISITQAGTTELAKLDGVVSRVQEHLLAPLSSTERRQLVRLLARLLEHHNLG